MWLIFVIPELRRPRHKEKYLWFEISLGCIFNSKISWNTKQDSVSEGRKKSKKKVKRKEGGGREGR